MAHDLTFFWAPLAPGALALAVAVAADLAIGDPVYAWHPVRLIGRTLAWMEAWLRRAGFDGYLGGILLFVGLATVSIAASCTAIVTATRLSETFAWAVHVYLLYSLLALGDLLHHVWRIERALRASDLTRARELVGVLVGRDTDRLDGAACRRAAVESLSENLTDGFVSPVCWYVLGGVPGLVLFKVVSTMDSMVGYKTPRYLQFGWCGARLDDLMNYLPARLTWLAVAAVAVVVPSCSGRKAWQVGLRQHALLLGPNSGWSEAAIAGALQRTIVGPVWLHGMKVTDLWIGDPDDPPLETASDTTRAMVLVAIGGALIAAAAVTLLLVGPHAR